MLIQVLRIYVTFMQFYFLIGLKKVVEQQLIENMVLLPKPMND